MANYNADILRIHSTDDATTLGLLRAKQWGFAETDGAIIIKKSDNSQHALAGNKVYYDVTDTDKYGLYCTSKGVTNLYYDTNNYATLTMNQYGNLTVTETGSTVYVNDVEFSIKRGGNPQLSLVYDDTHYVQLETDSNGDLIVQPTGNALMVMEVSGVAKLAACRYESTKDAVDNNEELGRLLFTGGTDTPTAGFGTWLSGVADGDWADNDYPTRLDFYINRDDQATGTKIASFKSTGAFLIYDSDAWNDAQYVSLSCDQYGNLNSDGSCILTAGNIFKIGTESGLSGTLVLDDGANWRVTLVFTGGILTSSTATTSSSAAGTWTPA